MSILCRKRMIIKDPIYPICKKKEETFIGTFIALMSMDERTVTWKRFHFVDSNHVCWRISRINQRERKFKSNGSYIYFSFLLGNLAKPLIIRIPSPWSALIVKSSKARKSFFQANESQLNLSHPRWFKTSKTLIGGLLDKIWLKLGSQYRCILWLQL